MKKKHIVSIGYMTFAVDSITAANTLIAALSKAEPVTYNYDTPGVRFYEPLKDKGRPREVELKLSQNYRPAAPPKPEPKALALPKPKRGTILCICEKSHVAPRETCPHCGRDFSVSHNRTHSSQKEPHLRLI